MQLTTDTSLKARFAKEGDEDLLLNWANDPLVRANSFNSAPIGATEHKKWFHQKLQQIETCKLYIIETADGLPIGQVRFDWDEKKTAWQINYSLASIARGKRLGIKLLQVALSQLRVTSTTIVYGKVKLENKASALIFRQLGFREIFQENQLFFIIENKNS